MQSPHCCFWRLILRSHSIVLAVAGLLCAAADAEQLALLLKSIRCQLQLPQAAVQIHTSS
jgi:hypothetical protein